MSTILREWVAVHSAPQLPCTDLLLNGKPTAARSTRQLELPPLLKHKLAEAYNESQVQRAC